MNQRIRGLHFSFIRAARTCRQDFPGRPKVNMLSMIFCGKVVSGLGAPQSRAPEVSRSIRPAVQDLGRGS